MAKHNAAALAAYAASKAKIDDLLARIKAATDSNLGDDAAAVNWGHAGSVGHAAEQLAELARFLQA